MSQNPKENQQLTNTDPFFGLKYIAYCRSQRPPEGVESDDIDIINYAKWQVCKARNLLFNDPIWKEYTAEEILIEYFAILFDESETLRDQFLSQARGLDKKDVAWLEAMEAKWVKEQQAKIKDALGGADEIEETF